MNDLTLCKCGHERSKHRYTFRRGNEILITDCLKYVKSNNSYDSVLCSCRTFKQNNLKYLEQIYEEKSR